MKLTIENPNIPTTFGELEPGDLFRWVRDTQAVYLRVQNTEHQKQAFVALRSISPEGRMSIQDAAIVYPGHCISYLGRLVVEGS